MGLSISSQNIVLNWIRGRGNAAPDNLWVGLHNEYPGTPGNERSSDYGGRIALSGDQLSEPYRGPAGIQEITNVVRLLSQPALTSNPLAAFTLWDGQIGGTMLLSGIAMLAGAPEAGKVVVIEAGNMALRVTPDQLAATNQGPVMMAAIPIATATVLGAVKIGSGILVTPDGTISVDLANVGTTDLSYDRATAQVRSSNGADATLTLADGTFPGRISSADWSKLVGIEPGATAYVLRAASRSSLGGVRVGDRLSVAGDGTLSADVQPGRDTNLSYAPSSREVLSSTGTSAILPLVGAGAAGLAPASGGGTANFLRADGTWVTPPGGGGGGNTNLALANNTADTLDITSDTGTDVTVPAATGVIAGLITAAGFTKLSGIATGATANSSDAQLRDRSTHTGTQTASTISDFNAAAAAAAPAANLTLANNTASTLDVLSSTGTDVTLPAATGSLAGLFTAAGFTKLGGIATGATANSPDATLLARANHTGTQAGSTVTGAYTASGLTLSTARILGRTTAATGAAEEISIGAGLSLAGGTLSSTASGATNLSLANNTASTLDVLSDTGSDVTLPAATGSLAGLFTAAGFTKLGGIATGATANSSDAVLLARANHTGTQAGSTVTGAYTTAGLTLNTARILGRTTAAAGAAEEISIGSGLLLSGGTLSSTASGATNLSLANNTASTLDVLSDTGTDVTLPAATGSLAGLFTATGFVKLGGIATGATANSPDATLLARANHTGTQVAATISDFSPAVVAALPIATDSVLGVVKIGTGLEVDGSGLLATLSQSNAFWDWTAAAGTTPATGKMQSSAANWAAATQTLYFHQTTKPGTDTSAYWPKLATGDTIIIQQRGLAANYVRCLVSSVPVLTGSVWAVAVTIFGSGGVEPNNNIEVMASFTYASDGGGGSGVTNLSLANNTANTLDVLSDTGTDVTLPAATGSLAGLFTSAGFTKLGGIAAGATANSSDAALLNRANHTGTQAGSTVTGAYTASGMTMATARMLGRSSASSGPAEEIAIGAGLQLTGGTLVNTGVAGDAATIYLTTIFNAA